MTKIKYHIKNCRRKNVRKQKKYEKHCWKYVCKYKNGKPSVIHGLGYWWLRMKKGSYIPVGIYDPFWRGRIYNVMKKVNCLCFWCAYYIAVFYYVLFYFSWLKLLLNTQFTLFAKVIVMRTNQHWRLMFISSICLNFRCSWETSN